MCEQTRIVNAMSVGIFTSHLTDTHTGLLLTFCEVKHIRTHTPADMGRCDKNGIRAKKENLFYHLIEV